MLKIIGVLIAAVGCSGIGFYESMELSKHEKTLKQVQQMLILLKGEIRYGNSSLCDVFDKISEKMEGDFKNFFQEMKQQFQKQQRIRFSEIYKESAKVTSVCKRMRTEEADQFIEFGKYLGSFDRETQLRQIELYEQELEVRLGELHKQLPVQKKLYQNLGVLGGIFLAILLW